MPALNKSIDKPIYKCLCCGHEYRKQDGNFFKSLYSKLWAENNNYVPVCKKCLETLYKEFSERYDSESALKIICAYTDMPYNGPLYFSLYDKNKQFSIGTYFRCIGNATQYRNKDFSFSLLNGDLFKNKNEIKEESESRWTKQDKQNMKYVISVVGYDPFDDSGLSSNDRKYCFNSLSGYFDTDGIKEDGHKKAACIQVVINLLQCHKIDELINSELTQVAPDQNKLKNYSASKTSLLNNISQLSKDNNLSSAYNGSAKAGKTTLTNKMQEMFADGIEGVKVNLFDIETSDAMKQIADISNQSILEQLSFDSNDYTQMIKEQREMIIELQSKLEETKEKYRLCNNELIDLKEAKKK